MSEIKATRPWF